MHQIKSYFLLYIKIIFTDKIPFIWMLALPLVIALFNGPNNTTDYSREDILSYLVLFWVYIILSSYLNGVGLRLAHMREHGLMKTYIMISGNKYTFIGAVILAQLLFSAVSLLIFTTVVTLVYGFFSIGLLAGSLIVLLCSLPLAVASIAITLLPAKNSSMTTIVNILLYPLFLLAINQSSHLISYLNPFYAMKQAALGVSNQVLQTEIPIELLATSGALFCYFILGLYAMKRFNLLSIVTR